MFKPYIWLLTLALLGFADTAYAIPYATQAIPSVVSAAPQLPWTNIDQMSDNEFLGGEQVSCKDSDEPVLHIGYKHGQDIYGFWVLGDRFVSAVFPNDQDVPTTVWYGYTKDKELEVKQTLTYTEGLSPCTWLVPKRAGI